MCQKWLCPSPEGGRREAHITATLITCHNTIKVRILMGSNEETSPRYLHQAFWGRTCYHHQPSVGSHMGHLHPSLSYDVTWLKPLRQRGNLVLIPEEAPYWWAERHTSEDNYLWIVGYNFWILSSEQLNCHSAARPWARAMEVRENKQMIHSFSHSVLRSNSYLNLQLGGWWWMVLLPMII